MTITILVTGGTGYIGTHTCVELINKGYKVIVVDNLSNSTLDSCEGVKAITKCNVNQYDFYNADVCDSLAMDIIFEKNKIDAVIHFAGLKSVGESIDKPLDYYNNNVVGTIVILNAMKKAKVKTIIFSSSATIYGDPVSLPIKENASVSTINPYGRSKLIIEEVLKDLHRAENDWKIGLLRYFNPVGAHKSGLIGENPIGVPNNLMPYVSQVAIGKLKKLKIFGNDYPTKDGTGVRDYIHVVDLANGHIAALKALNNKTKPFIQGGVLTVNLGTGKGYSVLDVVQAFEKASQHKVEYEFVERRPGDVAECYADSNFAEQIMGWKAQYDLKQMCEDTWRWQKKSVDSYSS